MKKIVIDTMGSDYPIEEVLSGVKKVFDFLNDEYKLVLVGNKETITNNLADIDIKKYEIVEAETEVTDSTSPFSMLKDANDTALVKGYKYLANDSDAIGMITCSSTGCVLVGSIFHLGLLGHLKFPVLGCVLYSRDLKPFILTDCGANVDCTENDLLNFATLSNAFMQSYYKLESPKVGLLSVGHQDTKGNELTKKTHKLLKESTLNFIGNIEANEVFNAKQDILISDGFTNNILLKNTESVTNIIKEYIQETISSDTSNTISKINNVFDYSNSAGAFLLGTKKILIKAHGNCNANSIVATVKQMIRLDEGKFIENLKKSFDKE